MTKSFIRSLLALILLLVLIVAALPTLASSAIPQRAAPGWQELTPSVSPPSRNDISTGMAYDTARGKAVLFGGYGDEGALADLWEWQSATQTWTERQPANGPSARFGHVLVYDEARGVTALFGGTNNNYTENQETWLWSGSAWSQVFPEDSPSPRWLAAAAYDPDQEVIVLYGGLDEGGLHTQDTWHFNGETWSEQTIIGPSYRAGSAMAYDAHRDVMVLFGGHNLFGSFNQTWERVGSGDWQLIPAAPKPPRRFRTAMVYVPPLQRMLLYGGAGELTYDDTNVWDGQRWRTRPFDPRPPARSSHAMVYDTVLNGVLLYGGGYGGAAKDDTWLFTK